MLPVRWYGPCCEHRREVAISTSSPSRRLASRDSAAISAVPMLRQSRPAWLDILRLALSLAPRCSPFLAEVTSFFGRPHLRCGRPICSWKRMKRRRRVPRFNCIGALYPGCVSR